LREWIANVRSQHHLSDNLTNWIWSLHQLETELFNARRPNDRGDLIRCSFLRKSKRPADSNIRPSPIHPIAYHQLFQAG